MRRDSWPGRVALTVARLTPAYRAAGLNRFARLPAAAHPARSTVDRAAVRAVARDVVARLAPAELPAFRAVSDAFFADPAWAWAGGSGAPLRFDVGGTVPLLTPGVLAAVAEAIRAPAGGESLPEVVRRHGLPAGTADLIRAALRDREHPTEPPGG